MKKLFIFLLCLVFVVPLLAQEKTLVGKDLHSGGFGAPVIKVTSLNGEGKVLTGGRGGWIINHQFVLGGGSYNTVNESRNEGIPFDVSYSGFEMEYIGRPFDLVHYSAYLLIGGGELHERIDNDNTTQMDGFFVLVPEVNMLVNITEHFHLGAGLGYRWVNGVEKFGLSDYDISGLSASLTFKFGSF